MIYEKGVATSLKNVGEKFLDFVKKHNDTTISWEVLDSRLDTFYGSTIKFPVSANINEDNSITYDYAYVSLQHNDITNTTYSDWLRSTKDNYMSEIYDHRNVVYTGRYSDDSNNYTSVNIIPKYGSTNNENIFKNTGEVIFIGTHTNYDENLWMCEQGGITCNRESKSQSISDNVIAPLKRYMDRGGAWNETIGTKLPPFPGMGCPSLSISDDNKNDYSTNINYYFVRDNYSANIVIYIESEYMKSLNKWLGSTLCQHISFGRVSSFSREEKFNFPLYVAGGNNGLSQDIWIYTPLYSSYKTYRTGNVYDLDMHNTCMSNSNLLLSTRFNNSAVSNFKVLCPDGEWEDIFNCSQNASIVNPHLEAGQIQQMWYYILSKPAHGNQLGNTTINNGEVANKRIDTYTIKEKLTDSTRVPTVVSMNAIKSSSILDPITVVLNNDSDNHKYGIIGNIPNCYSTWSRNLSFGEYTIGTKKYLCIPNVWDLRLWEYPSYIGVYAEQGNENVANKKEIEYNETYNTLYNYMIYDKIMLYMGEVD